MPKHSALATRARHTDHAQVNDWAGCYTTGWQGLIVQEAFSHPAKFSRSLIQRIYQHAKEEGWLKPGDICLDVFGGVSLGALDAMLMGCTHVSIELEERFHLLALENVALWERKYASMPGYGTAVCLHGDSRRLLEVLAGAPPVCILSSPPYVDCLTNGSSGIDKTKGIDPRHPDSQGVRRLEELAEGYGSTEGNLGNLPAGDVSLVLSSPPFGGVEPAQDTAFFAQHREAMGRDPVAPGGTPGHYGTTPGQLAGMVVTSPPFGESIADRPTGAEQVARFKEKMARDGHGHIGRVTSAGGYGTTPGQLAGMVATSPPFEDCVPQHNYAFRVPHDTTGNINTAYSEAQGQLGITSGDTFWSASRTILEQCYALLPTGGHAIFVVKAYVKDGAIVDFPGQWAALCQSVGFTWLHEHHALLTTDHGTELGLFGGETQRKTKRVSFFRMLHEKKCPDLAINWETILCMWKKG